MINNRDKTMKLNSRKKAQLHMGESIIVLIIFFIIISFGAIFYARISVEKTSQEKAELKTMDAVKIAQQIAKLPELICTNEGITDFDCFDEYKYRSFAIVGALPVHTKYYDTLFPNVKASIVKLYPQEETSITILDTTLKDENEQIVATSSSVFFIPVTIYNPIYEQSSFGYLKLEVYT